MRVFCTIFRTGRSNLRRAPPRAVNPSGPSIGLGERLRSELTAPTPGEVALEARQSESAGTRTGIIDV
jgi:hypothetical protein